MKNKLFRSLFGVVLGLSVVATCAADTIKTENPVPLSQAPELAGASLKPVQNGQLLIPTITWGGDTLAVYADSQGLYKAEGLNVQLYHEDNFAKQVRNVLDGKTPFLRGTFGMMQVAADEFRQQGTGLVVLDQITWSSGGDRLVVRPGIHSLADLRGKKIGLQLYGPHMDYLTTVLNRAGLSLSDVEVVWFKELSVPSYDTHGQIVDARTAFQHDPSLSAVFVISPDADVLTSNGAANGGTGSEGSVKGAKVLFSTKSADHIIADTWAVREDWYNAHRAEAEKYVHAILVAEEQWNALSANPSSNQSKYDSVITASGKLLESSKDDVKGMLGDCTFVGFQGNVAFFTGAGTTRNFTAMKDEIQKSFVALKLISANAPVVNPNWDYTKLTSGLSNVNLAAIPKEKFNQVKVQQQVEKEIASEPTQWEEGALVSFEIYFQPNQSTFSAQQYAADFEKVVKLSQTFGGAIVTVEGHNAPDLLNQAKASGDQSRVQQIEQAAKTLSLKRAQAVRDAYIAYAKGRKLTVDASQFVAVGMGATHPKFAVPHTKDEWSQNMRVVFRLKQVETESTSFQGN